LKLKFLLSNFELKATLIQCLQTDLAALPLLFFQGLSLSQILSLKLRLNRNSYQQRSQEQSKAKPRRRGRGHHPEQ